jgi:Fe2+ or Zn2+ uptake regulation protein
MVKILVCECKDCTHWEIVKDASDRVHLLCKSCGRTDEVDLEISVTQPARWIAMQKEQ